MLVTAADAVSTAERARQPIVETLAREVPPDCHGIETPHPVTRRTGEFNRAPMQRAKLQRVKRAVRMVQLVTGRHRRQITRTAAAG